MMFKFIIRYLGFMKYIPLVPWVADALLMIWNFIFNRQLIRTLEVIENEVSAWSGVTTTLHKYGGIQFNLFQAEIGHLHSNGVLDVLLSLQTKRTLLARKLADDHHTFKKSGWVTFYIHSHQDIRAAVRLLSLGYDARSRKLVPRRLAASKYGTELTGFYEGGSCLNTRTALH